MIHNKRLNAILELVSNKQILDIGSDHAILPIYAILNDKIKKAIVIEINNGPLLNGYLNAKNHDVNQNIKFIKNDGLKNISIDNIKDHTIVIAGMGGSLIIDILKNAKDVLVNNEMILQPNNKEKELREYLNDNGFNIEYDTYIKDNKIIYYIIKTSTDINKNKSNDDIKFGIDRKSTLFKEFHINKSNHLKKIIKEMPENSENYEKFMLEIKKIESILGDNNEII